MKTSKFLLLLVTVCFFNCKTPKEKEYIKLGGVVFGTTYIITYDGEKNYQKSIDSLFTLINNSTSTYVPNSDISNINKGDSMVVLDAYMQELMQKSFKIYQETDGYFDPTVGNLVNSYGFGSKKNQKIPSEDEIKEMLQYVGLHKVKVIDNKISKPKKVYLEFNSIGKGYGVDIIGRFLEEKKIKNYLIEIGGEIRTKGYKKDKILFKVAIESPNKDGSRTYQKIIEVHNIAMATSGNYRKFKVDENGNKFVHTINPKTGLAKESNLLSATVITKNDCADVDAYATAFMAMGLEKTKQFLQNRTDLKVILLYADKQGKILEYNSYTYK